MQLILQTLKVPTIFCLINGAKDFFKSNARLITNFGNFVFGFSSNRLRCFLFYVFRLQGKTGKMK